MWDGYEYLLFLSFTRGEGQRTGSGSLLSFCQGLHDALTDRVARRFGRVFPKRVFLDSDLLDGPGLEQQLSVALHRSAFLLVLGDNTYLANACCCWELATFLDRDRACGVADSTVLLKSLVPPETLHSPLDRLAAEDWDGILDRRFAVATRDRFASAIVSDVAGRLDAGGIPRADRVPVPGPGPFPLSTARPPGGARRRLPRK